MVLPTLIPRSPTVGRVADTVGFSSRLNAPVELRTRFTTADIVLELGRQYECCHGAWNKTDLISLSWYASRLAACLCPG